MKSRIGSIIVLVSALLIPGGGCGSSGSATDGGAGAGGKGAGGSGVAGSGAGGATGAGGAGAGGSAGADGGVRTDGSTSDGTVDAVDAAAATLTQVWSTVLTECSSGASPCCVGCHDGSLRNTPDYTSKATAFATLVGVPSQSCAGTRVTAGNAEASVLVNKVRAKPNIGLAVVCGGDPMPLIGAINLAQVHLIEAWINAGALDN